MIPPIAIPADNDYVKRIKIQSQILTKWWGHPIFLGAVVLLPKDYDKHPDVKYPIVYDEGHFSAPGGSPPAARAARRRRADAGLHRSYWLGDGTPRMIIVTLQHPSPYYDDSYGVNSENNGPYGDAIMQELMPAIETQFRVIRQPWARLLTGGSTGGWISLAHQVMYPDFYGGTWSLCPDGVDFRYHQIVNVYADSNAYWLDRGWMKIDRPTQRRPDGNITAMMKDENWFELVVGDHSRSGGQWDIWEATYGPVGADGYPQRIWDKKTGVIDKKVADYWKQHYDLRNILETNWATLGPKVANKINVYVGDADSYFLNMGVHMLDELSSRRRPIRSGRARSSFQPMAPHCWGPSLPELIPKMTAHMEKYAPAGADLKSWRSRPWPPRPRAAGGGVGGWFRCWSLFWCWGRALRPGGRGRRLPATATPCPRVGGRVAGAGARPAGLVGLACAGAEAAPRAVRGFRAVPAENPRRPPVLRSTRGPRPPPSLRLFGGAGASCHP